METSIKNEIEHLFEYGIFQENSDIRAHVSSRIVYVYETEKGRTAIKNGSFRRGNAMQPGYSKITGSGILVPPEFIDGLIRLYFKSWTGWAFYSPDMSTTQKGNWAVTCVKDLMKIGRFPFFIDAYNKDRQSISIEEDKNGTDILVCLDKRIQVKCDYPAAKTGNLFLQTHEINPYKKT